MNRLGTCVFAHQLQEVIRERLNPQPHERPEVITAPEMYLCGILDCVEAAPPPPLVRAAGVGEGFLLRPGDCEACVHYHPAGGPQLASLLKSRARPLKRRGRKSKVKT